MKNFFNKYKGLILLTVVLFVIVMLYNDVISQYSNSLMVVITFVYVVATIEICDANISVVNTSEKQLEESKRQYEETKRLQIKPYFQCEEQKNRVADGEYSLNLSLDSSDLNGKTYGETISIKNVGLGPAKDIKYIYNNDSGSYDRGAFVFQSLQSGEKAYICINFLVPLKIKDKYSVNIDLSYKDLLENTYKQRIEYIFEKTKENLPIDLILKQRNFYPPELVI